MSTLITECMDPGALDARMVKYQQKQAKLKAKTEAEKQAKVAVKKNRKRKEPEPAVPQCPKVIHLLCTFRSPELDRIRSHCGCVCTEEASYRSDGFTGSGSLHPAILHAADVT
jgi:hypothetical protein